MSAEILEIPATASPIVETVRQTGLHYEDVILDASGVLNLHGIREANNVNLIVKPEVFDEMRAARQTPNGIALRVVKFTSSALRLHLQNRFTPHEDCLPLDITTFSYGDREQKFRTLQTRAAIDPFDIGIPQLSLRQILFDKSQSHRLKDRLDVVRIYRHMGKPALQACRLAVGSGKRLASS